MQATAPRIQNSIPTVHPDLQLHRPDGRLKVVGILLLAAFFITSLAVYSVFLKFQTDCDYFQIQDAKKRQAALRVRLEKLEARVVALSSYNRIERDLAKNKVEMSVPKEMFAVDLTEGAPRMALLPKQEKDL